MQCYAVLTLPALASVQPKALTGPADLPAVESCSSRLISGAGTGPGPDAAGALGGRPGSHREQ